ncbi:MAG: energy transducer TonB [Polyangiaceae bacterium]|jgi:protein TonB
MASATGTTRTTNGRGHGPLPAFATAGAVPYDDPMSKVLGLDAKTSGLAAWFGFTSAGTVLLVWVMALALLLAWWRATHVSPLRETPEEIEIMKEDTPPPPPPPVVQENKPEPVPARVTPHEAPPPPPSPAQAAKVLTAEPKPDEPLDLTGNTIVTGNADTFAGGFTASNGTNPNAVHTMPSQAGVSGGTGKPQAAAPAPAGPDRSRGASLSGGSQWSCPFPSEADTAQIDEAFVSLQVDVQPDGTPTAVRITQDPGNGFGREARRCAMNKHYQSALDHDGTPISGTWKARVHFSR